MPKGRSFESLAATAPSVNTGQLEGGIQVNGASAGENNFTVDSVSVNSQIHGHQRQDAVFEHLQEVQVKTSGLSAEYGGALGGVISAVTRSGGNDFKGSVFYYYGSDALASTSGLDQRLVLDPTTQNRAYTVQDTAQSFDRHEVGASLGGPILKDKLYFFASTTQAFEDRTRDYQLGHRPRDRQAGAPGPEQLRQAHVGGHQPAAVQRLRSPHPHEGRGDAGRVRRRRRQRQHAGGRGRHRQQRPGLQDSPVAGRGHRGLHDLQRDHRLPARRPLPRQLRGHRCQHEPDLRVRHVVGGARGRAGPVPAAGRLLEPPARDGERPRSHHAQVRQPGADHGAAGGRHPQPQARRGLVTLHERRRARVSQPGLRHRLLGPELHQPGHRRDRPGRLRLLHDRRRRGRSARRAPTSSTCSCRTPGGSPRG